ncbi:hypothetical protein FD17_GL000216 [Lentilactobacillus sunkii DSM 19904]|uniref:Uncharacterized protein n=2 Tax=Lentilactobacillus sunkii TaxID=481719 RepID=A0A0R1LBQ4_9LACO|nr:hypothetical protein FD17_GL000216 [Lentilactobacillus sunkii DSM 19904]
MLVTIAIGLVLMILTNNRPFAITLAVLAILITIMMTIKKIIERNKSNHKDHSKS